MDLMTRFTMSEEYELLDVELDSEDDLDLEEFLDSKDNPEFDTLSLELGDDFLVEG